jgi:transcriptional regulator with XRE-family HTH domain
MDAASVLRRARTDAGLTLRELASLAGTSHATLSAYEHGAKTPNADTLERIVTAAGFALDASLSRRWTQSPSPTGPIDRGEELEAVLELAAAFPARHSRTLEMPAFGRAGRR